MAMLDVANLHAFHGKAEALHGISFSVEKGSMVGIIGPNGAGKSTLLDSLLGLVKTTGSVALDGKPIAGLAAAEIVRSGVGYAPERGHLFPYMGVRDNLLVGSYSSRRDIEKNLRLIYDLFPVLEQREAQETSTLSGGERQMVSLGRALMTSPRLLLVDEPTIGLAPKVCLDIASALRRLNAETGLTILITEQNVNFAMSLASTVHIIETGEIRMSGPVDELRHHDALREAYFGT
ncbi:MAG: ABC transporter ATP-binding protein [Hyphomicrobiaceae bacterium]